MTTPDPSPITPIRGKAVTVPLKPSLLTVPEVIAELRVSSSTFYYWRQTGKGPRSFKLPNGAIRIRRVDLDDWLAGREEAA